MIGEGVLEDEEGRDSFLALAIAARLGFTRPPACLGPLRLGVIL